MSRIRSMMLHGSLVLLAGGWAQAAEHYVRPGGAGAGSSWADALATLPSSLVRGDTYYIASGIYGPYRFGDAGTATVIVKKATLADHGTEDGWDSSYAAGPATWTGPDTVWTFGPNVSNYLLDGQEGVEGVAGSYGFRLQSTASRASPTALLAPDTSGVWDESGELTDLQIRYVELDWDNGTATGSTGATRGAQMNSGRLNNGIRFERCYVHHSSGFAFYFGSVGADLVVDGCVLELNGGEQAYHHETLWVTGVTDFTFSNNIIRGQLPGALTGWVMIGAVTNARIFNNLFTCAPGVPCSTGGNGIIATWDAGEWQNHGVDIQHNTFVDLAGAGGERALLDRSTGRRAGSGRGHRPRRLRVRRN